MNTVSLDLTKGQRLDITKTNPSLKIAAIGLGWDAGNNFDLDAFILALKNGKIESAPRDVLFFNNKKLFNGGIIHSGDNLTGAGDGDDETMTVDFSKLPSDITEIVICVNIYQAESRRQNFGQVNNAFVRVYDFDTKAEICKFDLSEDYSAFNAMIMGKLYLKDGEWKFQAIGEGKNGSITEVSESYL